MAQPFRQTNFGRYLLTERIATGGMAEIFSAKVFGAMGFEKQLVIKRILPQYAEDAEFLQMFITEAKLVCHLEHPNIVQVHELGETDGRYYIAMEHVNGIDARQLWRTLARRRQRLPGVLALFIVAEFLKGLDYAHRAVGPDGELLGVVHRDVSPSNILISYRGDVKISDFGIALVHQESKTQAGVLKGKFGYMTPEQVAGMKVDHRSDIFAAGIVLAELLLGRRLFLGSSYFETLDKVLNVRLDVLEEHEAALPPEVVQIVRRALQRETDTRYQSAKEFGDAIVEFLYDRRARITNETLANFIADHVSPFLETRDDSASKPPSASGGATPSRSPVVPRRLVPGDMKLSKQVHGRPTEPEHPASAATAGPAEAAASPEERRSKKQAITEETPPLVVLEPASPEPAPSTPRPIPPEAAALVDDQEDMVTETDQAISTEQLLGADQGKSEGEQANIISSALELPEGKGDIQFGAIPVYEADGKQGGKRRHEGGGLEAQRTLTEEHSLEEKAFDEQELDFALDGWDEEDLNFAPFVKEEPSVLVSSQMFSPKPETKDALSFCGKLPTETVTKVLFRHHLDRETGLLVITGPEATGRQAELMEWLRGIQVRVGAESDSSCQESRTCSLHLMSGHPHLISADRNEEAIVAFLVRAGVLDEEKVEKAIVASPNRKPIAALLAAGVLAPLQVLRHLTAFVLDIVHESFSWMEGDIAFFRGRENPTEAFPSGGDAVGLINKGVGQMPEAILDDYFEQLEGHRVFLNRSPPAPIDRFGPNPILREAYRELSNSRPVEEMLQAFASHGERLAAKQALYMFIECELALLTVA